MKHWLMFLILAPLTALAGDVSIVVVGTAQDAGLPQIGCKKAHCLAAAKDPSLRRLVSSILVVDGDQRWLVDATPDIREQVARMEPRKNAAGQTGRRPRLVDGVFLTHAHMGHYTGLLQFGPEAYNHSLIPVYGSERMKRFLSTNGPWSLLVDQKIIEPRALKPDQPFPLSSQVQVIPFNVPHREEFTDTYGYIFKGPNRSVMFIPDIDKWEKWDRSIEDMIASVDVALLDGAFFADGEIPGRAMSQIPHPFIAESLARFADLPEKERNKVVFTHLNHTNPAVDPQSEAAAKIKAAGMSVAYDGQIIQL